MQTFSRLGAKSLQTLQTLSTEPLFNPFWSAPVTTSKAQMQPNTADLETLPEIARFQKAAFKFTAASELAPWRSKNISSKKYPCLTRSGAPPNQDHAFKYA
jgi:hypothetical protein